jgi:hypothetical protein
MAKKKHPRHSTSQYFVYLVLIRKSRCFRKNTSHEGQGYCETVLYVAAFNSKKKGVDMASFLGGIPPPVARFARGLILIVFFL